MPNENGYITVGEMKKFLKSYTDDDSIFTITNIPNNPDGCSHITQVFGYDEGEVGLDIELVFNKDGEQVYINEIKE